MKIKRLVARSDYSGRFLKLEVTFSTTHPKIVDHPFYATLITPHEECDYENPKPATYYFENSDRMRRWLVGFKMVAVEFDIDYKLV